MTIVDRINKVTEVITKEQYGPDSPIVQLLMIVSAQDDEIHELKKDVRQLQRVSRQIDTDQHQMD